MTESKIIEQIRQLLRIASDRGASINERELAQRRAERLMVRYRIESLPEDDARAKDEDITSMEVEIKGGSASMARAIVDGFATLARSLSCFCSWRTYKRRARRLRVRHRLYGRAPGRPARGYRRVLTTAPRRP